VSIEKILGCDVKSSEGVNRSGPNLTPSVIKTRDPLVTKTRDQLVTKQEIH